MLLEVCQEGQPERREVVWDGAKSFVIGRSRDVDIVIPDPLLSRHHCRLETVADTPFMVDMGSANGTMVNGVKHRRVALGLGDRIQLGRSWVEVKSLGNEVVATAKSETQAQVPEAFANAPGARKPEIPGYVVGKVLGRGSFGAVYEATQEASGKSFAVKVIPSGTGAKPQSVARFVREIEALRRVSHPNLIAMEGAGQAAGFAYLIMEKVDGQTLAQLLRQEGRLGAMRSLRVVRQLVEALVHAHDLGFVHRDIKPENALVDHYDNLKLCDFGLVKNLGGDLVAQGLTRPGEGFGSVAYMAPEQISNAKGADERADVYGVGSTLYFLLTGKRPFSGKLSRGLLKQVMQEQPTPIRRYVPGVPWLIEALVERCMCKEPEDRFQSALALLTAIEQVMALMTGKVGVATVSGGTAPTLQVPAELEQERQAAPSAPEFATPPKPPIVKEHRGGDRTQLGVPVFADLKPVFPKSQTPPVRLGDAQGLDDESTAKPTQRTTPAQHTAVGVPVFEASGIHAPAQRAKTEAFGVPDFSGEGEGVSPKGQTQLGVPSFGATLELDDDSALRPSQPAVPGKHTAVGVPVFEASGAHAPAAHAKTEAFGVPDFGDGDDDESGRRARTEVVAVPEFAPELPQVVEPQLPVQQFAKTEVVAVPDFASESAAPARDQQFDKTEAVPMPEAVRQARAQQFAKTEAVAIPDFEAMRPKDSRLPPPQLTPEDQVADTADDACLSAASLDGGGAPALPPAASAPVFPPQHAGGARKTEAISAPAFFDSAPATGDASSGSTTWIVEREPEAKPRPKGFFARVAGLFRRGG